MPSLPDCRHDVRQTAKHLFECLHCGTIFLGMDRRDPKLGYMIDRINGGHSFANAYLNPTPAYTSQNPNIPLDFQAVPEDIAAIKAKMDDLEQALSLFAGILKDAIQT